MTARAVVCTLPRAIPSYVALHSLTGSILPVLVAKQVDLYIVQSNENIGQTQCELQFATFNIGKPRHQVIQDPGRNFPVSSQ